MISIRPEAPADAASVRRVNALAFGGEEEADLVEAVRAAGGWSLSLVAEEEGEVVGHILFTIVTIESPDGDSEAAALGPMAVLPERQRRGIGSLLVRAGLERCRAADRPVVVVVGHPEYYPRFGFLPAEERGLRFTLPLPPGVFMVAELEPGALAGRTGVVRYRAEFESV